MSNQAQFLCILRPTRLEMVTEGPSEREARIIERHFAYLSALAQQGILVLAGRTLDNSDATRGIAILHAPDEDEAARLVREDPAISEGVMTAVLQPFRIAIQSW